MKMSKLEIRGWRSFDSTGIGIKELKKNNIFIGQNNTGKSNIAKFFLRLKEIANETLLTSRLQNSGTDYQQINIELDECESWAWKKQDIKCKIEIDYESTDWRNNSPQFKSDVALTGRYSFESKTLDLAIEINGQSLCSKNQIYDFEQMKYVDPNRNSEGIADTAIYWKGTH